MRAASTRVALMLAAGAVCVLFTATSSLALYRDAMGPAQCCQSHCPHRKPGSAPARCCQIAPGPPVAAGSDETARQAPARAASVSRAIAPRDPLLLVPSPIPAHPITALPPASLYALRTSLLR